MILDGRVAESAECWAGSSEGEGCRARAYLQGEGGDGKQPKDGDTGDEQSTGRQYVINRSLKLFDLRAFKDLFFLNRFVIAGVGFFLIGTSNVSWCTSPN